MFQNNVIRFVQREKPSFFRFTVLKWAIFIKNISKKQQIIFGNKVEPRGVKSNYFGADLHLLQ